MPIKDNWKIPIELRRKSKLLVKVEFILNLHLLTYLYKENDEPQSLTPMYFFNFGKELSFPINFFHLIEDGSKRSFLKEKYINPYC